MTEFYYLLMSKFELLTNNVIEEVLRERANYYFAKKRNNDFWLIEAPQFINDKKLSEEIEKIKFFDKNCEYFAIVSSDKIFINWLALRIGYFEPINNKKIASKREYTINGITGQIKYSIKNLLNPLISEI